MTNTNVKSPWPGPAGLIPVTSGRADDAKNLGLMNWIGMEPNEEFKAIMATGAKTGRIIKPFLDHEKILCEIRVEEEAGAIAVGIDIDHISSSWQNSLWHPASYGSAGDQEGTRWIWYRDLCGLLYGYRL